MTERKTENPEETQSNMYTEKENTALRTGPHACEGHLKSLDSRRLLLEPQVRLQDSGSCKHLDSDVFAH